MNRIQMWFVGALVAVVVVAAGGYFLAISPEHSHAASLRSQAAAQTQANQVLQGKIQVLQGQTSDVATAQARIAAISNELPPTANIASYVRALVLAAKTAGVDLISIAPGGTSAVSAAAPAAAPAAAATPAATASAGAVTSRTTTTGTATTPVTTTPVVTATTLNTTPLTLSVNGGYFQVEQFLAQLEKLPRSTIVDSVSLAPGAPLKADGAGGSGGAGALWKSIQTSITINIFEAPALAATTVPTASASPSTVQ
jgi:Tfp pilus assembly protein PilO